MGKSINTISKQFAKECYSDESEGLLKYCQIGKDRVNILPVKGPHDTLIFEGQTSSMSRVLEKIRSRYNGYTTRKSEGTRGDYFDLISEQLDCDYKTKKFEQVKKIPQCLAFMSDLAFSSLMHTNKDEHYYERLSRYSKYSERSGLNSAYKYYKSIGIDFQNLFKYAVNKYFKQHGWEPSPSSKIINDVASDAIKRYIAYTKNNELLTISEQGHYIFTKEIQSKYRTIGYTFSATEAKPMVAFCSNWEVMIWIKHPLCKVGNVKPILHLPANLHTHYLSNHELFHSEETKIETISKCYLKVYTNSNLPCLLYNKAHTNLKQETIFNHKMLRYKNNTAVAAVFPNIDIDNRKVSLSIAYTTNINDQHVYYLNTTLPISKVNKLWNKLTNIKNGQRTRKAGGSAYVHTGAQYSYIRYAIQNAFLKTLRRVLPAKIGRILVMDADEQAFKKLSPSEKHQALYDLGFPFKDKKGKKAFESKSFIIIHDELIKAIARTCRDRGILMSAVPIFDVQKTCHVCGYPVPVNGRAICPACSAGEVIEAQSSTVLESEGMLKGIELEYKTGSFTASNLLFSVIDRKYQTPVLPGENWATLSRNFGEDLAGFKYLLSGANSLHGLKFEANQKAIKNSRNKTESGKPLQFSKFIPDSDSRVEAQFLESGNAFKVDLSSYLFNLCNNSAHEESDELSGIHRMLKLLKNNSNKAAIPSSTVDRWTTLINESSHLNALNYNHAVKSIPELSPSIKSYSSIANTAWVRAKTYALQYKLKNKENVGLYSDTMSTLQRFKTDLDGSKGNIFDCSYTEGLFTSGEIIMDSATQEGISFKWDKYIHSYISKCNLDFHTCADSVYKYDIDMFKKNVNYLKAIAFEAAHSYAFIHSSYSIPFVEYFLASTYEGKSYDEYMEYLNDENRNIATDLALHDKFKEILKKYGKCDKESLEKYWYDHPDFIAYKSPRGLETFEEFKEYLLHDYRGNSILDSLDESRIKVLLTKYKASKEDYDIWLNYIQTGTGGKEVENTELYKWMRKLDPDYIANHIATIDIFVFYLYFFNDYYSTLLEATYTGPIDYDDCMQALDNKGRLAELYNCKNISEMLTKPTKYLYRPKYYTDVQSLANYYQYLYGIQITVKSFEHSSHRETTQYNKSKIPYHLKTADKELEMAESCTKLSGMHRIAKYNKYRFVWCSRLGSNISEYIEPINPDNVRNTVRGVNKIKQTPSYYTPEPVIESSAFKAGKTTQFKTAPMNYIRIKNKLENHTGQCYRYGNTDKAVSQAFLATSIHPIHKVESACIYDILHITRESNMTYNVFLNCDLKVPLQKHYCIGHDLDGFKADVGKYDGTIRSGYDVKKYDRYTKGRDGKLHKFVQSYTPTSIEVNSKTLYDCFIKDLEKDEFSTINSYIPIYHRTANDLLDSGKLHSGSTGFNLAQSTEMKRIEGLKEIDSDWIIYDNMIYNRKPEALSRFMDLSEMQNYPKLAYYYTGGLARLPRDFEDGEVFGNGGVHRIQTTLECIDSMQYPADWFLFNDSFNDIEDVMPEILGPEHFSKSKVGNLTVYSSDRKEVSEYASAIINWISHPSVLRKVIDCNYTFKAAVDHLYYMPSNFKYYKCTMDVQFHDKYKNSKDILSKFFGLGKVVKNSWFYTDVKEVLTYLAHLPLRSLIMLVDRGETAKSAQLNRCRKDGKEVKSSVLNKPNGKQALRSTSFRELPRVKFVYTPSKHLQGIEKLLPSIYRTHTPKWESKAEHRRARKVINAYMRWPNLFESFVYRNGYTSKDDQGLFHQVFLDQCINDFLDTISEGIGRCKDLNILRDLSIAEREQVHFYEHVRLAEKVLDDIESLSDIERKFFDKYKYIVRRAYYLFETLNHKDAKASLLERLSCNIINNNIKQNQKLKVKLRRHR